MMLSAMLHDKTWQLYGHFALNPPRRGPKNELRIILPTAPRLKEFYQLEPH